MKHPIRVRILAEHLDCDPGDIRHLHGNTYGSGDREWLVLTETEAERAAIAACEETLWAFRTTFLARYIPALADARAAKAWETMVGKLCEDATPLVSAMLGRRRREMIRDAIKADGRGHYLSGYDGEEVEHQYRSGSTVRYWYIYRQN